MRANTINDIHAARSPAGQLINSDTPRGNIKSSIIPSELSKSWSTFRGTFSMNVPSTRRLIIRNMVLGKWRTDRILYIHASKLVSIMGSDCVFGGLGVLGELGCDILQGGGILLSFDFTHRL
jgi:hypothetical protein